ncbi:DNA ligase 6 isoform X3 [Cynara cardunculus var. scolymus]|uniref:DNA ligase 6 isoform X3 n=1 Tax=Cynara cardunculus var. scolymus TaxID=59895 RepID=UPI000D624C93|nr:DNA ligase 6 isoform X3 [Cynara cardunculus var. scolymus]
MASSSSSQAKTLTLDSATLFLQSPQIVSPPLSFSLLSAGSSLPPMPTDFPLSKVIPKTNFIVDGFRYSGDYSVSYFLSHFHSDHYCGLNANWSRGIIFCSSVTARLVVQVLKVSESFVVPLPLSESVLVDGCEISLVDANHCPGAVQFLFKIPTGDGSCERYVHTGDFRYCSSMTSETGLKEFIGADAIFLDTTYCNPKYVFPSQGESIDYVVSMIDKYRVENEGGLKSVLFLVATYVIGKEKILLEISRRCNRKIHVDDRKFGILRTLGFGKDAVFTNKECETDVHVIGWNVLGETWPYFRPNFAKMQEIKDAKGYSKVVGFVPTGWTYEVKRNKFAVRTKDSFEIHLVPYSEHSNYQELREYVKFLRPKRVIPTVGVDVENFDGKHVNKMLKHFAGLVDEMAIKQDFLMGFHRGSKELNEKVEKDSHNLNENVQGPEKDMAVAEQEARNDTSALHDQKEDRGSRDLVMITDKETDEIIQELRDCLPAWVTRDQMMDLISKSGKNIVEAVSNFYEHETEYHEQVITSTSSAPASLESSIEILKEVIAHASSTCASNKTFSKDFTSPSSPVKFLLKSEESPSKRKISSNIKQSSKSSISPNKKRKINDSKSSKKPRITSQLGSGGPKQCTITKFFNKLSPMASQDRSAGTLPERSHNDDKLLPTTAVRHYKDEVDQFIQIINGSESLRSYATTILEETKGDINKALDVYYNNSKDKHSETNKRAVQSSCFVEASTGICSYDQDTKVADRDKRDKSWSKQPTESLGTQPPAGNVASNLVSLPPEKYSPTDHACWKDDQPAPYLHLARTFNLVEDEKGKIKATSMLCNMFRSLLILSPEDVLPAVYLCTNKIAPDHENTELNIGGSIVTAALEEACGTNRSKIRDLYNSLGDVAQLCRQTQKLLAPPAPLSIGGVYSVLREISVQTGSGSTMRRRNLIVNLMRSCREMEIKFIVRTLVRNLRIGAMMRTVLPALAQAIVMNSGHERTMENLKERLQGLSAAVVEAYNILPNLDLLIPSVMDNGIKFSPETLSMVPGIPIKPMLAKITNGIPQALKLFQGKALTCEFKYDGQRAQIHKLADGSIRVFSRNGDETTFRFPDLISIINELCNPDTVTFIIDAEVVAVDRKNGPKLLSFQELSSRDRGGKNSFIAVDKIKARIYSITSILTKLFFEHRGAYLVDICVFAFDVMFANGEQLLGLPLRQRRKYLNDLFGDEKKGYFEYSQQITVEVDDAYVTNEATMTKMNKFFDDAFHSSCEGIMVKSLDVDAGYLPSKRSDSWLKVKRDYVEGLNDSLDLVPIGAWYGNGRKAGWYSPFLMACFDPDTDEYQSVCRVMSGFSDGFYVEMKDFFVDDKILPKNEKPSYYQTGEEPDMWFTPELVWEIRGADFTVSPVHHAAIGLVHPSRGISVRFPRFIRSRSDKKPSGCSTAMDIAEMFHLQTRKMDVRGGN